MGFLAITNAYTMRICLSVAITEMVKKNKRNETEFDGGDYCPIPEDQKNDEDFVCFITLLMNTNKIIKF